MDYCVYCQAALEAGARVCRACGRAQPFAPPASGSGPEALRCPACGQAAQAEDRFCMRCASPLRQSCPACGQETFIWARFCPTCAHLLSESSEQQAEHASQQTLVTPMGIGFPEGAGAPPLPDYSATPQVGTPSVPSAPAGSQTGAPSVPSASGSPQTGQAMQAAGKAAARGLAPRLLGTVAGKVLTGVLAVVVVATGAAIGVVTATGGNPTAIVAPTSQPTGGAAASPTLAPSPTPQPPEEVTYIGSDGNIWEMTVPEGTPRQLTNDAQPDNYIVYSGLAWSPDGKRLAAMWGISNSNNEQLRILSPEGAVLLQITLPGDAGGIAWSPDGRLIAYRERDSGSSSFQDTFYAFNSSTGALEKSVPFDNGGNCDGGAEGLINTILSLDQDSYWPFRWATDQQAMLVWTGCISIEQLDLNTGNLTPGYPAGAIYQPGGELILGTWSDKASGTMVLGLTDATGKPVRTLTSEQNNVPGTYEIGLGQAAWSTDGQSIYYERDDGIWSVGVDGSNAHLLIAGTPLDAQGQATVDVAPQPSPDGTLLLYAQIQGGDRDSDTANGQWYIAQADGTNQVPLLQATFQSSPFPTGVTEMIWRPEA